MLNFRQKNPTLFKKNCDVHSHATRNCKNLAVFQHSKSIYKKSPKYRRMHVYDKLPDQVKSEPSLKLFKKKLFNFLFDLNLYRIRDFYDL